MPLVIVQTVSRKNFLVAVTHVQSCFDSTILCKVKYPFYKTILLNSIIKNYWEFYTIISGLFYGKITENIPRVICNLSGELLSRVATNNVSFSSVRNRNDRSSASVTLLLPYNVICCVPSNRIVAAAKPFNGSTIQYQYIDKEVFMNW